jgi:hypothetical protein
MAGLPVAPETTPIDSSNGIRKIHMQNTVVISTSVSVMTIA